MPTNEILTKEMPVEKICDNLSKRQRKLGTCPYNQNKRSLSNDDVSTSESMDMLDGSASPKSLNVRQRSFSTDSSTFSPCESIASINADDSILMDNSSLGSYIII